MKRRTFLAWALAGSTVGCARVARSGPVVEVSQSAAAPASQGVEIAPQEPIRGGDPEAILAGFLTAMASYQSDYSVARSYLTAEAAKHWQPSSGVTIYDSSSHKPATTDKTAALSAPMVGVLDAEGRFTPRSGTVTHDFKMTKENDEWRIARPPEGLLVARYLFSRYYTPVTLWFLAPDLVTCAPDVAYLPDRTVTASTVLGALFAGPSQWTRAVITTALPPELRDANTTVEVKPGEPATVSLSSRALSLPDDVRRRAVAQIVLTLTELPGIDQVRMLVNGTPWQVGNSPSEALTRVDVSTFLAVDVRAPAQPFAVTNGVLGRLSETGAFAPITGVFGKTGWGAKAGAFDISRDLTHAAMVSSDADGLWAAGLEGGTASLRLEGEELTRPQFALDGSLWVFSHHNGTPVASRFDLEGKRRSLVPLGLPAEAKVLAFRLSPDATRMAVVVRRGETTELGMLRVLHDRLDGWLPMPVSASTGALVSASDVDWVEAHTMVVVAATDNDPRPAVYRVSADGARVEALGPASSDMEAVGVAAQARPDGTTAMLLTGDGRVLRFEDRFRWAQVASKVTALALPG